MKFHTFFPLLLIHFVTDYSQGENILFFWAVSGTSHRITVWPLVEKLIERGHNITFFSPFPPKKKNLNVHEIVVESLMQDSGLSVDFLDERVRGGAPAISKLWSTYYDFSINSCDAIIRNQKLVEWIHSSKYDLVVINAMMNDCGYGLAYKFKCKHVIYGTTAPFMWWPESFGYPDENYPEFQYHYPLDMTFFQSVTNLLQPLNWRWNRLNYMFPKVETILRTGLNLPDMPSLAEIESNVSLVLMNTHFSDDFPRSLPPMFVQVGGMHCTANLKPLSEELENFIARSEEGFVYFSFGTFASITSLPDSIVENIFSTMTNLSELNFVVKWGNDLNIDVANNIKLVKWVSQQDVLGHPKIKAFISHGGLLGTQEALFHGVPTIVIPLFAEQDYNAERVRQRGRGLVLDIGNLTKNNLKDAVQEILRNDSYIKITKKVSKLFRDRPMQPVDTAVWWVEYVLRNEDAKHLQPIGLTRNWMQRRMLDIWSFVLICILLGLCFVFLIVKLLIRRACAYKATRETWKIKKNI